MHALVECGEISRLLPFSPLSFCTTPGLSKCSVGKLAGSLRLLSTSPIHYTTHMTVKHFTGFSLPVYTASTLVHIITVFHLCFLPFAGGWSECLLPQGLQESCNDVNPPTSLLLTSLQWFPLHLGSPCPCPGCVPASADLCPPVHSRHWATLTGCASVP